MLYKKETKRGRNHPKNRRTSRLIRKGLFLILGFSSMAECEERVIATTQKIEIDQFPDAFNPSLLPFKEGFLLTFHTIPDKHNPRIAHLGIVQLDHQFIPINQPQLLTLRLIGGKVPHQVENAHLFSYQERIFISCLDNHEDFSEKKLFYLAELFEGREGRFTLSIPLKLHYTPTSFAPTSIKSWVPFEWEEELFFSHTTSPHEILYVNRITGVCYHSHDTWPCFKWQWGIPQGATPALKINSEKYLSFFYSTPFTSCEAKREKIGEWEECVGAYTFAAHPPFQITEITSTPLPEMMSFLGSFVIEEEVLYLPYSRHGSEIWIATVNKQALLQGLKIVTLEDLIPKQPQN